MAGKMKIVTMNKVQLYYNWSLHVLLGVNPTEVDKFLRANMQSIKQISFELLNELNVEPQEIYRGILMDEENLSELLPHKNMTYLSFSEDIKIAQSFADVNGFGSEFGINSRLGNSGYIITYTPKLSEILFHPKFLEIFPYRKHMQEIVGSTATTLDIQKEVIILQPAEPFKISHHKTATPEQNFNDLQNIIFTSYSHNY